MVEARKFVRRNVVDSNQIPSRTRFLKSARAMTSLFTAKPDLTSYQKLTPKVALDEMNPPLKTLAGKQVLAARQSAAMNWSEPDDIPEKTLNQIPWWDAKGYIKPCPKP